MRDGPEPPRPIVPDTCGIYGVVRLFIRFESGPDYYMGTKAHKDVRALDGAMGMGSNPNVPQKKIKKNLVV